MQFESCWRKELAQTITEPEQLLAQLQIDKQRFIQGFSARKLFPLRAPRPFVAKMAKGDIYDPLFLQVMTQQQEFDEVAGFTRDPLEEQQAALPGLLHKYKSRVLILLRGGCAVNCRYCFRRHFPYQDNALNQAKIEQILNYIQSHPEINEVVLSGGDPLMAQDHHIASLLTQLEQIDHLTRLRIHTRLPVVIPQRLTPELADMLKSSRLKVIMVLHINHANEVDSFLANHLAKFKQPNITLLNQAVLLKGVNDNVEALVQLSERLFAVGILPYYIHLFDKVAGAAHFYLSDEQVRPLQQGLLAELPGFLVPKWVREEAGLMSKSPVVLI
ncbi:KamA family protein [Catenovulum agarivorans DS-2]|uniref:L-lysine 2,3-aminomutase n=1 Tax=Catenovulum agarivorans DS-2 TaxID=1328313 RepID=W7QXS1_9ALTE|nr:KamA family protein [Catenovulum agarivorans DS-2]